MVLSYLPEGLWKWLDDLFMIDLYCQYTTWYYGKELLCGPEPQVQLLKVSLFLQLGGFHPSLHCSPSIGARITVILGKLTVTRGTLHDNMLRIWVL